MGKSVLLTVLAVSAACVVLAPAKASPVVASPVVFEDEIFLSYYLETDGSGQIQAESNLTGGRDVLEWQVCPPDAACMPIAPPATDYSYYLTGNPAVGTRWVITDSNATKSISVTTDPWRGPLTVDVPLAHTGKLSVGEIVKFNRVAWGGAWGHERSTVTIESCRTADRRGCVGIYDDVYIPSCGARGAVLSPADAGRYIIIHDSPVSKEQAFPAIGLIPPLRRRSFAGPYGHHVSVLAGRVSAKRTRKYPKCAWWRGRSWLRTVQLRKRVKRVGDEARIGSALCYENCTVRFTIKNERGVFRFHERLMASYAAQELKVPLFMLDMLGDGSAKVRTRVNGKQLFTGSIQLR